MSLFKKEVNEQDLIDAQKEIKESIDAITKPSLLELRAMLKPHEMVEKCM
jgi:hypothetical protein